MYPFECRCPEASGSRLAPRTALFAALVLLFWFPPGFPLYSQDDPFPLSAEAYLHRLQTAGADTLREEYEAEFVILLEENERKVYQALSLPQRRDYIALYWRLRDPDPFTPVNERLEEHLRRRVHAREQFHLDKPPYFDDRGKIYLKYGRPKFRYIDPGGVNMTITQDLSLLVPDGGFAPEQVVFDSTGIRRISQTNPPHPWERTAAMLPPGSVSVLANETWSYDHIHPGLVFNFVQQGQHFKQTPDLRSAINGGRMQHRLLQAAALYLQRQTISPAYFELARDLETIGQEMRSPTGGISSQRVEDKIYRAVTQTTSDVKQAMHEAPPEAFIYKVKTEALPFVADIAQFRGEQNQTRVAIGFGVNLGEIGMAADSSGNWLSRVNYAYVLHNHLGETLARANQQQIIPMAASGAASVLGSVGVMEFHCGPGVYILSLQAAAANGVYKSLSRLPFTVRDFRGSQLMLSDIQFFLQIAVAASSADAAREAATKPVLYPFGVALKSLPLLISFEIYNLTAIGLDKNYQIDYRIAEVKRDQNLLSKLSQPFSKQDEISITISEIRTVTQPMARESLSLSLEKLRPGSYQLDITVRAVDNAAILAKAAKQFVLAGE
ncbi:MAG: GWxTD domain-containing protein [candidate division KSB1 bacterium]|nr:GWxTD domain-containing protein [candidate division KSB1 bacterium]MDZ7367940.1 GWxTD domain-containing protein [candidate division KSB1 bacterium]MDZ7405563.1 GWxTD domain-containing protein [candidate division KSB1 bacterium]